MVGETQSTRVVYTLARTGIEILNVGLKSFNSSNLANVRPGLSCDYWEG